MPYFQNSTGLQALQLLAVAAMGLGIAWGTLLLGRLFRRRSAPFRELILKGGVCLMLGWPVLVLAGAILASVTRPEPIFVSVPNASVSTPSPSPGGRGELSQSVVAGRKRETVGTVWTPAENFAKTAEKTFEELFTEPSPEIGMSYTMLSLPRLIEVAIITWGVGLIVSLGFLLRDLRRVHRVRQRMVPCSHELATTLLAQVCQSIGLRHTPALLFSPDLTSPCTAGIRRPAVVLPASMLEGAIDRDALLGVLTHEVAHVRRRDVAWSLLVRIARAIYWWQYELVIIDRRLSQLREEICDNYVLLAPVDRRVYAKTLLDFAEASVMRPLVGVIGMMGKNNPLSNRIERMLAENAQPQTRTSGWSRTGLICGGLVAVATVGLLGVWAERAGAVDPLIVRANLQSRNLSFQTEARPWSGQSEVAPVPAWSGSSSVPRDQPIERSNVTSRPGRTREDSSIPGMAQVRSDIGFEPSEAPPLFPSSPLSESFTEADLVPVTIMVPVTKTEYRAVVRMMPRHQVKLAGSNDLEQRIFTITLDVPAEPIWTEGQPVHLKVQLPAGHANLPQQINIDRLSIADPKMLTAQEPESPSAVVDPLSGKAVAPQTPGQEVTPPAPPAAEPVATVTPQKVLLTGPWQAVVTAKWMIELGGVPTLTASTTPETKTEIPAGVTSQGTRYQLVCEATSDETGQLKGILCFGREIPIGEAGPVESFKSFAATWKQQCQSVRQAAPSFDPTPLPPLPSYHDPTPSRPVPGYVLAPTETKAVHRELLIVLNVPDTMRYGEVQKIAMACDSDDVYVEVRSGSSPTASEPHRKSYTSVELTRVYDKQGKPVGPGAILVAHKFGVTDPQIITDNHWNRALGDFARRHSIGTNILLVNADADVPLDVLRDLQIRANREGIEEVQFLTGAVPAALVIQSSDGLFPLLDDLPMPSAQGEFDLDSPNDGIPTYSTDLNPPMNPIPVGTYRGI